MPYDVNKYERDLEKKRIKENKKTAKLIERRENKRKKIINFLKNNEGKAFTEKEINNELSFSETFKDIHDSDRTANLLDGLVKDSSYNIHQFYKTKYFLLLFDYTDDYYYYGQKIKQT